MEAQFKKLYNAIAERLKDKAPSIKWVDLEAGQLENYKEGFRPPVNFPCSLIDFDGWSWEDVTNRIQIGTGMVVLRLGFANFSNTSQATPEILRGAGLKYIEIEQEVYLALQGWSDGVITKLARRSSYKEKRNDPIKVLVLQFICSFKDISAVPVRTSTERPDATIGNDRLD